MGDDLAAVVEANGSRRRPHVEADDVAGGEDLGAELVGLPAGSVGELGAGHAVGETEVVLDARALPRLPSRRPPLDQHRAQALRRGVYGGAKPGRSTADDHDVVEVGGRAS